MFKKLFQKAPQPSDWMPWMCLVENKPASISVNLLAHNEVTKFYESLVVLTVENLGTSRNGFPEAALFDELYKLEEGLEALLQKHNAVYPGRFITDGIAYYLIYTNETEKVQSDVGTFLKKSYEYTFEISIREGNNWSDYYKMLYPPVREQQEYRAFLITSRLKEAGDNPEIERNIDHIVLFTDQKSRSAFIKDLEKRNFPATFSELEENSGQEYPFTLEIHVMSTPQIDLITSTIDILITLAEKYEAVYDGWGTEVKK